MLLRASWAWIGLLFAFTGLLLTEACGEISPIAVQRDEAPANDLNSVRSAKPLVAAQFLSDTKAQSKDGMSIPVALTASDGTGLNLLSYHAKGFIQGPLALTEIHLVFKNPRSSVIEGRFEITLPQNAAISRFAMKIGQRWQEAEVVERKRARRVYEDFLHRKQDPALLEKDAGNRFRARVFPIAANANKEIIIGYSQELIKKSSEYRLFLKGLAMVSELKVSVRDGNQLYEQHRYDFAPTADLIVKPSQDAQGLVHQNIALARITPAAKPQSDPLKNLLILVDTSASRALGLDAQVRQLGLIIEELKQKNKAIMLQVVCFDQEIAPVFKGSIHDFNQKHLQLILDRMALGASDLERALDWADQQDASRILLVSDGIATAGKIKANELKTMIKKMAPATTRIDALAFGGIRDESFLKEIVRGNLKNDGVIIPSDISAEEVAKRLFEHTISNVEIKVEGANWVWPSRLDGLQSHDQVLVYVDIPQEKRINNRLSVQLSGGVQRVEEIELRPVEKLLLERSWVRARINRLIHLRENDVHKDPDLVGLYQTNIINLSIKHRILSDYTALLVLETEFDYQRYGIRRRGLSDILSVDKNGLVVLKRKNLDPAKMRDPRGLGGLGVRRNNAAGRMGAKRGSGLRQIFGRNAALGNDSDDAMGSFIGDNAGELNGVGGLRGSGSGGGGAVGDGGTIGPGSLRIRRSNGKRGHISSDGVLGTLGTKGRAGSGGSGRGYGRGRLASRRAAIPRVSVGRAVVRGALDKNIIRRVIRRHINEVRYCYERELITHPRLEGRVMAKFIITPNGKVSAASVVSSTLNNRRVERCTANAIKRWEFPRVAGGNVVVKYPFMFRPSGNVRGASRNVRRTPQSRRTRAVQEVKKSKSLAYTGRFARIHDLLEQKKINDALVVSLKWRREKPGDILAYVALGLVFEKKKEKRNAARVYGSIIDLYPSRADLRRYAGNRLEALGHVGLFLAADTYRKAVENRADHPTGYRLLAYALTRLGKYREAIDTLDKGLKQNYRRGFFGFKRIFKEDKAIIARAWIAKHHHQRKTIEKELMHDDIAVDKKPSMRFVLSWETDTNDVDLHIYDRYAEHAYYRQRSLSSGGNLYADLTAGYGPECFAMHKRPSAFPYRLKVHYYSRGPMGYGIGTVQGVRHDGRGNLKYVYRPFVVMKDGAYLDLDPVEKSDL